MHNMVYRTCIWRLGIELIYTKVYLNRIKFKLKINANIGWYIYELCIYCVMSQIKLYGNFHSSCQYNFMKWSIAHKIKMFTLLNSQFWIPCLFVLCFIILQLELLIFCWYFDSGDSTLFDFQQHHSYWHFIDLKK
jgi:hypothetical protein